MTLHARSTRHLALLLCLPLVGLGCSETPTPSDGGDGGDGGLPADLTYDRQPFTTPDLYVVPDLVPSKSDRCGGGTKLELPAGGGQVTVSGDTSEANNEYGDAVRCGGGVGYAGPQRYYQMELEEGRTYRFTLRPQGFAAYGYLTSSCAANVINADCSSSGATGLRTGRVAAGESVAVLFIPGASGSFHFAVDSTSFDERGGFELTVETFAKPPGSSCVDAETLGPLVDGKATVSASTLGAVNEFEDDVTCGLGLTFDGPQRYYAVSLEQGLWYRLSLSADFAAGLYVFNSAAECDWQNIEQDCSNITGTILPPVTAGPQGGATLFSPPASGSYLIAVDSLEPLATGGFTLGVERVAAVGNEVCGEASAATLIDGRTVIRDDTSGRLNDRGAQMRCGGPPLTGPQAYYRVALVKDTSYLLTLTTPFDAVLAVGEGCVSLPVDCGSAGLSGTSIAVPAGGSGTVSFRAAVTAEHVVVVDGLEGGEGKLKLTIAESSGPTNGSCATPAALTLGAGPLVVGGDTGPLQNDLEGVDCGDAAGPWPGPQAYYRVSLAAGQSLAVELSPESTFDAALYALAASTPCEAGAINAACSGKASDVTGGGATESLTLQGPAGGGDFLIVVDSWSKSDVGTFALSLQPTP